MKLLYAYNQKLKDPIFKVAQRDVNIFKQIYMLDADGWLVDRTQTLNFPFSEKLLDRYAFPTLELVTFADAAIDHANKLLNLNKPISILWSGGIDSTAVVVAFLETNRPLDNVRIVLNNDSIKEYKLFYEKYIRPKFQIIVTEEAMLKMAVGQLEGIVVSGELADQLVGSPLVNYMHQAMPAGFLRTNCNYENFKELCKTKRMEQVSINCWFDLYSATFKKSPRPIVTMYDFAWWHGFNFRWQSNDLKIYLRIHKNIDFRTFYSGQLFQSWSIGYQPNLDDIHLLKSEIKNFVRSITNDDVYFSNKIKHPSSTLYYAVPAAAAIDENFNTIQQADFGLRFFYNANNSIVEWLNNR